MKRFQLLFSIASALALGACGGDAAVEVLGSLGAGGGQWFVDADPSTTGYQRADCSGNPCNLTFFNGNLYERSYAERIAGTNPPSCTGLHDGTVTDAVNISVPQCFEGRFLNANEALSTDGKVHLYYDLDPEMNKGVWVDIHDDAHRFVFNGSGDINTVPIPTGCEISGSGKNKLSFKISKSNFAAIAAVIAPAPVPAAVPRTTVQTLTIEGPSSRTFVGEFVAASALRLTRSGETIELQRRNLVGSCS